MLAGTLALMPGALSAETTIVAMGDSLTQGYGLAPEDGFVPVLEAWLEDHGHEVTVVNAGVSGDTSAGGLSRIDWTLTDDVDAMVLELGANDMLRGIDPAETFRNLNRILRKVSDAGVPVLLVGIAASPNYGQDYADEFNEIFPTLADRYETLLFPGFLAGLRGAVGDSRDMARLVQADGLHPSAQGVKVIVSTIGPSVLQLIAEAEDRED